MAVHSIMLPHARWEDDLYSIVWDDEGGTVEGEHPEIYQIRRIFDAPKPVTVGTPGSTWDLRDPAHDPAEFHVLLGFAVLGSLPGAPEIRAGCPPALRDVEIPDPDPGERLWLIDPESGELVEVT